MQFKKSAELSLDEAHAAYSASNHDVGDYLHHRLSAMFRNTVPIYGFASLKRRALAIHSVIRRSPS